MRRALFRAFTVVVHADLWLVDRLLKLHRHLAERWKLDGHV